MARRGLLVGSRSFLVRPPRLYGCAQHRVIAVQREEGLVKVSVVRLFLSMVV